MRLPIYLDSARDDLQAILRYITRSSGHRTVGRAFVDELRGQCAKLAALPHTLGTGRPELHPDIRSFVHKGYVILFRYHGGKFVVVNVIEGHRDIEGIFANKAAL